MPPLPPPSSSGNSHVAGQIEVLNLTEASQRERLQHEQMLLDLEAKKRAFSVDVPTLPQDVRTALRKMGLPVRLFGENLANVRDRLRMELARRQVRKEQGLDVPFKEEPYHQQQQQQVLKEEEEEITKYSRATPDLIRAREQFAKYSLEQAKLRLDKERNYRVQWQRKRARLTTLSKQEDDEDAAQYADVTRIEDECLQTYKSIKNIGLEGSQYGDARPISSIATSQQHLGNIPLIATGSWSGTIKLWDGSSPELKLVSQTNMAHEDRIMGIALQPQTDGSNDSILAATCSIDLTAKLWKISLRDIDSMQEEEEEVDTPARDDYNKFQVKEVAHLKGHARRLCKVAFHPQGTHVATTSFDHTWRLWDVETGSELLLQDGHWKEVFGVGFHTDGSLCSTTDFGSVVQLWDLRSGKSIHHFLGHAKRVLCTEFSSNGFQLATAGDDGTIKIWDLRKRKQFASIPAHTNLVTQLQFDRTKNGEFLVSTSFDATSKIWSTRDWNSLTTMRGHEGKVMGAGILKDSIVTSGFDKTLKLWR
ncbi:sigma 54 interacting domain protein [Nitzschia inconspicua]|uniref:Sigma 54 interacting domain protein n=1 Tax=Nitzschia inconspicua TaxID=303405 RepID=A0A9K3LJ05_9STRA|nr:sigma 54 interacting domain protein [Nitzschia inconspicua]